MTSRPRPLVLPLLLCLALLTTSGAAGAAAPSSGAAPPEGTPDLRAHMLGAAGDPALRPWQRDVMLQVAQGRVPGDAHATNLPDAPLFAAPNAPAARVTAVDGSWKKYFPEARINAPAIYDPVRKRMIVFAGNYEGGDRNDTWALSLTGAAVWTLINTAISPPVREGHSAIYDSARDRMVIFGGYDGTNRLRDVWSLSLAGTPAWTNITPPGGVLTGPTPRYYHTAIYDPVRDRMLVLGGYDSFYLGDVWALPFAGTPAWTQLAPAGPSAGLFVDHTTIYDPVRDRLITFGGYDGVNRRNDTWALTLSGTPTWSLITVSGTIPPPITAMRGTYDPVRDRLVCFGGYDLVHYYGSQVYALTLSGTPTWSLLAPSGTPPAGRAEAMVVYDPNADRLVAFAGTDGPNGLIYHSLEDAWALSLAGTPGWTPLPPGPDAPTSRYSANGIVDPANRRFLIYGGSNGSTSFGEVRAFSLGATPMWSLLNTIGVGPGAGSVNVAFYDGRRSRMIAYAASNMPGGPYVLSALSLTGTPTWTPLTANGTPPPPRFGYSTVLDTQHDRMLVFGGYFGPSTFNDVWALSLAGTPTWTQLAPTGTPPAPRYDHLAFYDPVRDRMIVYRGHDPNPFSDMWSLNLSSTPSWTQLSPVGSGPPDLGQLGTYDPVRDRILIVDGPVYALRLAGTPTWSTLSSGGDPFTVHSYAAVDYDPIADQLLVSCGYGLAYTHDVWSLYWGTPIADVGSDRGAVEFSLGAPNPNPARGGTSIEFDVPRAARVRLAVYDLQGRQVRLLEDAALAPGRYTRSWSGADQQGVQAPAGVYFVRLEAPGASLHAKLVRLR